MNTKNSVEPVVYIIDDNELNTTLLKQMMEFYAKKINRSCLIKTFSNPREAFDEIIGHSPDTIITDQKMPGMKGTVLINNILESDQISEKPQMILLSGDTSTKEIFELKKAKHEKVKAIMDKVGGKEQVYDILNIVFDIKNQETKSA